MSTIASPRDSSVNGRRIPLISTPTASSRNSLDIPQTRSQDPSPSRGPGTSSARPEKRNRAALRSYYNLKNPQPPALQEDTSSLPSETSSIHDLSFSDLSPSPLDSPSFDSQKYINNVLENESLESLLRIYNGVLMDIRALDAERKALVYDNYSKLIVATETIGRMRSEMEPGDPVAKKLGGEIGTVYERAGRLRGEMRVLAEKGKGERAKEVVKRVLEAPGRVRGLVGEGRMEEARKEWGDALRLLERWRERGVGGEDVLDCIEDGEAALKGDPPTEKSWSNLRNSSETKS